MSAVTIRDAREQDCAAVSDLALASKAYWGYDDTFMAACRDELTLRASDLARSRVRVAERGGRIIGFHGVTFDDDRAELEWLFVAPDAIRSGIGQQLYADAAGIALGTGAAKFRIQADPHAVRFYERMGARFVGEVPSASIAGRVIPVLEADLSSTE
jgi:GNAT superfamily N-acetyltransferase